MSPAAGGDTPHRLVRATAFTASLVYGGGSWYCRDTDPGYASLMLAGAIALLLVAITLPILRKLTVSPTGGVAVEVGPRELERDAAAKAADAGVPAEVITSQIQSEDDGPPTPSQEDADVIGTLNYMAGSVALSGIFDWMTRGTALEGCDLRLYLYDADVDRLVPILDPARAPDHQPTAWEIGKGATGAAYQSHQYVLATGPAVADDTYGLDVEQRDRFKSLAAVAAAPIFNAAGDVIGVLTASTSDLNHRLATHDGESDHTMGALLASRVLVELLQWFEDE